MKIAFLDRDGTIIKDYPDQLWSQISEPEFLPHSIESLQKIIHKGFQIIIITNQVGDSVCDVQLGKKLKITTFGINIDYPNIIKINDLSDVLDYI